MELFNYNSFLKSGGCIAKAIKKAFGFSAHIERLQLWAIGDNHHEISGYRSWGHFLYGNGEDPFPTAKEIKVTSNNGYSAIRQEPQQKFSKYYDYLICKYNSGYDNNGLLDFTSIMLRNIVFEDSAKPWGKLECDDNEYFLLCYLWHSFFSCLNLTNYSVKYNADEFEQDKSKINDLFIHHQDYFNISKEDAKELLKISDYCKVKNQIVKKLKEGKISIKCEQTMDFIKTAASLFLHLITIAYCETCKIKLPTDDDIKPSIFGGDIMEKDVRATNRQALLNLYTIFSGNAILQEVYSLLLNDYIRYSTDPSAKPLVRTRTTDGCISSYILFIEKLLPFVNSDFSTLDELFHLPVYLCYHNRDVQQMIFDSRSIFKGSYKFYERYYYQTEIHTKYELHSAEHDFLSSIPMPENNFRDASVGYDFLRSENEEVIFSHHCYGEVFKTLRLRRVRMADKDECMRIYELNKGFETDKNIYIPTMLKEAEEASNNGQMYLIEEVNDDKTTIIAYGILCLDVLTHVSYGKTLIKCIHENKMSLSETSILNTVYVTPEMRGFGLQRLLTATLTASARRILGKKQIVLTVSESNTVSYRNLSAMNFKPISKAYYQDENGTYERDFCCLKL